MSGTSSRDHTDTEAHLDDAIKFLETARDDNNETYEVYDWWMDDKKYFLEEGRLFPKCDRKATGCLKAKFYRSSAENYKADFAFLREKEKEYLYLTPDEELTYDGLFLKQQIGKIIHDELKKYLISLYNDLKNEL